MTANRINLSHLALAAQMLGGRFTLGVLHELTAAPRRLSELRRKLPSVPARSLIRILVKLEKNGLVERRVLAGRPPQVVYQMSRPDPLLVEIISLLARWGASLSARSQE